MLTIDVATLRCGGGGWHGDCPL